MLCAGQDPRDAGVIDPYRDAEIRSCGSLRIVSGTIDYYGTGSPAPVAGDVMVGSRGTSVRSVFRRGQRARGRSRARRLVGDSRISFLVSRLVTDRHDAHARSDSRFEWLRVPRFLLQVIQFLYRYLMVLMEEANAMRQAGSARGRPSGMGKLRALRFRQAAAVAGVLFARSYARAEAIHRAMLSRGFEGRLPARVRLR